MITRLTFACTPYFQLLNVQVEKCQSAAHGNDTLRTLTAHRCSQATVELDDDQLVEQFSRIVDVRFDQFFVRDDLQSQNDQTSRASSAGH